jgi:general nucleoside transport system ATP-binding protein
VADLPAEGADKAMLAEAMVGRAVAPATKRSHPRGAVVAELRGATLRGPGARPLLDVSELSLHAGEVFAVAGVAGNGQEALAELLCGLHAPDSGTRAFVGAGVARIPEDRHAVGVVGDLPLWENAVLERYATPAFSRHGLVRRDRAMAHAQSLVERFDVRGTESAGLATTTRSLSGGNMQKLILGRALSGDPDSNAPPVLIVANQPTWGLDIGAVAYVHQQLLDACAAGSAVLLISEDLDEIFALADRIAVMHHGRLGAPRAAADWTLVALGLAMAGGEAASEAAHAT